MSDDLAQTVRVPGPSEIVGFCAAGLPFLLSTATSSSSTVNGEVVAFVYRDWTAVGGGAVALVCGVISLLLLRRRTTNKPVRIAIAVGLLALGGFHVARGFGVMAGGAASSSTSMTITTREREPAPVIPAVDLDKPMQQFEERWSAGKIDEVYRDAHAKLREVTKLAELQRLHVLFDKGFGKLTGLGKVSSKYEEPRFIVTAPAIFEQGKLELRIDFELVGSTPKIIELNIEADKSFQRPMNVEDADQIAVKFAEDLLKGNLDRSALDPRVVANLKADTDAKLDETRKAMGPRKPLPLKPNDMKCEGDKRCVQFNLRGKQNATITVELEYAIRSWLITSFNFETKE